MENVLGSSCCSRKALWTGLAATGSFVQRSPKPLPWVHFCPSSAVAVQSETTCLNTVCTPTHVAMCDRALGGFPWLLISILAPKSYFLGGDKSPDKFSGVDLDKKLNFEYEKLKLVNFCSNDHFALSFFFPSEKFHVCCTHPLLYPRL